MIDQKIKDTYQNMSKTQKKIANFITGNPSEAAYHNGKSLALAAGVSQASLIRFCTFLGYSGFPQMHRDLQELARAQDNMRERVRRSYKAYGEKEEGVAKIFHDDMDRIEQSLEKLDMKDFFQTCSEMVLADRIYIIASRSAAALGSFFQYYLNMALGNVMLVTEEGQSADILSGLRHQDMVIGITFSRYASRTLALFRYASERGANTVAITDTEFSPVKEYARHIFYTCTAMPTYLDSFAAPVSLINAFLTEIGRMRNIELEHRVSELDNFYKEFHVFE